MEKPMTTESRKTVQIRQKIKRNIWVGLCNEWQDAVKPLYDNQRWCINRYR